MGHDWQIEQPFQVDEASMTSREKSMLEGTYARTRHKLRHMQPGNIVCSSAQGADLVLDESALLTNRRGNEILLRDQDQAMIFRSLQQFHAMSGARVYAGMIQRDGALLQTQMVSDGLEWDQSQQYMGFGLAGRPIFGGSESSAPNADGELPSIIRATSNTSDGSDTVEGCFNTGFLGPNPGFGDTQLQPTRILARRFSNNTLLSPMMILTKGGERLDPYNIFGRAGFIDSDGKVDAIIPDGAAESIFKTDTVYGGKPFYRVSKPNTQGEVENAVEEASTDALTEYRIEVSHTADGSLPVTEQTDGFDADRLPGEGANAISSNAPYIEVVYGSVVGNDFFSEEGKNSYGVPLKPVIFDSDGARKAGMEVFNGAPIHEHAATLLSITPPAALGASDSVPTFVSFTKGGALKSFINGAKSNAIELACNGPIVVNSPQTRITGGVTINGVTVNGANHGFDVKVPKGAIWLEANGQTEVGAIAGRLGMTPAKADLPSIMLRGRKPIALQSDEKILMAAQEIRGEANNNINLNAVSADVVVKAGEKIRFSAKEYNFNSTGKIVFSAGGPEDGLPTSGPNEDITYTRTFVGECRTVSTNMGDHVHKMGTGGPCNRTRTIYVGDDEKHCMAGKQTISISFGATKAEFTASSSEITTVGTAKMTGQVSALVKGTAVASLESSGPATVKGMIVSLEATAGKKGMILCTSDICPATGQPYASPIHGMMGSPGHFLK
jgi:hypothetical protein